MIGYFSGGVRVVLSKVDDRDGRRRRPSEGVKYLVISAVIGGYDAWVS